MLGRVRAILCSGDEFNGKSELTHLPGKPFLSIPRGLGETLSKRLGGNIGCKDKTSSWHFVGFPLYDVLYVCLLPIHSGHQVRWTYQPGSHRRKVTGFFIHLPSAVRALIFLARRIQLLFLTRTIHCRIAVHYNIMTLVSYSILSWM